MLQSARRFVKGKGLLRMRAIARPAANFCLRSFYTSLAKFTSHPAPKTLPEE